MEKKRNPALHGWSPSKYLLLPFLRYYFKLLYHKFAWSYDWVATIVSLGMWRTWVISILPYVNGPNVLEIGFGTGHLQASLNQINLLSFGLDESSQMVKITCQRLSDLSLCARLTRGEAQRLPFANESFQQVVATFPSEYILHESTIKEIHRVIVQGGSAIIVPLAWITGNKPWEKAMAWVNHITGEAPDWNENAIEPLKKLGFDISWEMRNLKSSRVLIIQMNKSI